MKKLTGTARSCIRGVLLILLIVTMTTTGCTFGAQVPEPSEQQNGDISIVSALMQHLSAASDDKLLRVNQFEYDLNFLKLSGQPDNKFQARAYLAKIDPESFYYMCAYYSGTSEDETKTYACAEEYTWTKFESADAIPEFYNDKKFIVAFQINETKECQNVMPITETVPPLTYFQKYMPEFSDGYNISAPLLIDKTFIVRDMIFETSHIIFTEERGFYPTAQACVVLDGVCYLAEKLGVEFTDGTYDLRGGKYNSVLNQVMITGKYTQTDEKGNTIHYGLFKLDDIVEILLNWEDE